nr:hypothetical protein Itr_chr02CG10190 [Ipomoea trifida]
MKGGLFYGQKDKLFLYDHLLDMVLRPLKIKDPKYMATQFIYGAQSELQINRS